MNGPPSPAGEVGDPATVTVRFLEVAPPLPGESPSVRLALLVLLELPSDADSGAIVVAPASATQEGLARRLGVTQGAVSKVVRRLIAVGVVRQGRGHVAGGGRQVRFYALTERGHQLVLAYRERFSPPANLPPKPAS